MPVFVCALVAVCRSTGSACTIGDLDLVTNGRTPSAGKRSIPAERLGILRTGRTRRWSSVLANTSVVGCEYVGVNCEVQLQRRMILHWNSCPPTEFLRFVISFACESSLSAAA